MKGICFPEESKPTRLYHSGDLGDIIYSLLFAKTLRPVHLILGPDTRFELREQMTKQRFEWLEPLLRSQCWIKELDYSDHPVPVKHNLNEFRSTWFDPRTGCAKKRRLFETYPQHFGYPALPEDEPWLSAVPTGESQRPVVINRSFRYRNPRFPWKEISRKYAGRMRFVGLEDEYEDWVSQFGKTAEYRPVDSAMELAQMIAGSELFIGNQSFPMSLALALNVRIVQETFDGTPDCIFHRPNVIYGHLTTRFQLPEISMATHRVVTTRPNRDGLIELGPCADAFGIGDTLSITPLAKGLGKRAVMILPKSMENMEFMFRNLCQTRISEQHPVFLWIGGKQLVSLSKLQMFNLGHLDPMPHIELDPEQIKEAKAAISHYANPIAFCPTCSKQWSHMRQRPPFYWKTIIPVLLKRYTVLQFGWPDYPLIDGAVRMPFSSLEQTAALYSVIGNYVGVHTGDYHLMLAVGGRCVVADAEPQPKFNRECWTYDASKRVQYAMLSDPRTVLEAIERLEL